MEKRRRTFLEFLSLGQGGYETGKVRISTGLLQHLEITCSWVACYYDDAVIESVNECTVQPSRR